jgi:hypothetical protein
MITKGDDGWGDAKPSSFGKPVPTLNMKGLTNFVEKADDGWGDDVTLSKKEAPKRDVSNTDNNEDEEEVKLSILKRKRNSNGLNQSKLADLKKKENFYKNYRELQVLLGVYLYLNKNQKNLNQNPCKFLVIYNFD